MAIDFYYLPPSPPCRTVMLLAKAIGVHLNLKTVNVLNGDHLKPDFLKVNPQHVIPTIDDNGFILCERYEPRPILGYLVDKYAKNDALYPRDPKKRGVVDERLYFDIEMLFGGFVTVFLPIIFGARHSGRVDEEKLKNLEKACETLNTFLEGSDFVAGDELTIADFSISTTICTIQCCDFDIGRYDNVASWYGRCKEAMEKFGFDEVHAAGVKIFTELYHANLQESA